MQNNYVSSNEGLVIRVLAPEEEHGIHSVQGILYCFEFGVSSCLRNPSGKK